MGIVYDKYPLYNLIFNLLLDTLPRLRKFPKDQRYLLAQRIENLQLDLLEKSQEAILFPSNRVALVKDINCKLDVLRSLYRLAYYFRFISAKGYGAVIDQIEKIGLTAGGWIKK